MFAVVIRENTETTLKLSQVHDQFWPSRYGHFHIEPTKEFDE